MSAQDYLTMLASIPTDRGSLRRDQFDNEAHAGGSGETTILSHKARQPLTLRNGGQYRISPVVRETVTTDGTTGNTETFTLGHDLIESDVTEDIVVYKSGSRVTLDAVDYAADTFDFTDSGSNNDLTVYYVSDVQASVKVKKVGPGGSISETLVRHDASLINQRDPNRDPLEVDLGKSPVQGTIPTDWSLEVTISGPYNSGFSDSDPTPENFLVSFPVERAQTSEVDGLGSFVRSDSSQRV